MRTNMFTMRYVRFLMPFEQFTKKTAQAAGTPYVTIQKRGVFALNHAAYATLQDPKAVILLFDHERRLVGFRKADATAEHAYPVRPNHKETAHLVTGALFSSHYGIPTDTARRWPARMIEDGILAIDLTEPPLGTDQPVMLRNESPIDGSAAIDE